MNSDMNETGGQDHMVPKQAYEKPAVTTLGTVAKLTLTKASHGGDGASAKGTRIP